MYIVSQVVTCDTKSAKCPFTHKGKQPINPNGKLLVTTIKYIQRNDKDVCCDHNNKVNGFNDLHLHRWSDMWWQLADSKDSDWTSEEELMAWQIILHCLLIFGETNAPKLICLSPFNETVFHDSCLPICKNLISIFPRAHSCGGTHF